VTVLKLAAISAVPVGNVVDPNSFFSDSDPEFFPHFRDRIL
jgi:hypothetical protein